MGPDTRDNGTDLTLEELDRDGALLEGIAGLYGDTRAEFLRKAMIGGGTLLAALAASPLVQGERLAPSDMRIFQYALNFEYLQATFYTEAEQAGTVAKMGPAKEVWARTLGAHERAHVRIIKKVLGKDATKKPFFNFHGKTESEEQ